MLRGIMIPGLAMAASEFPKIDGFHYINNPGVEGSLDIEHQYTLEDVAKIHAKEITKLPKSNSFIAVGMSMGGMILSVLASKYRSIFPENTKFLFLVTSANTNEKPAVPDSLMNEWFECKPGDLEDFEKIMRPFFSDNFLKSHLDICSKYFEYCAFSGNQQSEKSFVKQLSALRAFDGAKYFSKINPNESAFVGGAKDYILGPKHNAILKKLVPDAQHLEVQDLGHMINLEKPEEIERLVNELC